jgi:hypothetical protein
MPKGLGKLIALAVVIIVVLVIALGGGYYWMYIPNYRVVSPNDFGIYNEATPNAFTNGLTDAENKLFSGVDMGTVSNSTTAECQAACDSKVSCNGFTRPIGQGDLVKGECFLKKIPVLAGGEMLSNISGPNYKSWVKTQGYRKMKLKDQNGRIVEF